MRVLLYALAAVLALGVLLVLGRRLAARTLFRLIPDLVLRHLAKKAGRDVIVEHWRGDEQTLDQILRLVRVR